MLFLKPLKAEHADLLRQHAALFRFVAAADAAEDILLHAHVREQRVLLKEITDLALLRRQVDLLFAVKEHAVAEHDAPAVGRHDARDALQGHALAAARGAEQRHRLIRRFKLGMQRERTELFFNIDGQTHLLALLALLASVRKSRRSSILTASSTTVEIAILTMTHFIASASLFVCQS